MIRHWLLAHGTLLGCDRFCAKVRAADNAAFKKACSISCPDNLETNVESSGKGKDHFIGCDGCG